MAAKYLIGLILFPVVYSSAFAAEPMLLTLKDALVKATNQNLMIQSQATKADAQKSRIGGAYAPSAPMIGVSELNRGNRTTYATLQQKIEFPAKYFAKAHKERGLYQLESSKLRKTKLTIRASVLSTYYRLHAVQNIIQITKRDLQRLKEVSRNAESKYAAGKAPQTDSMKAHVAQTQTEAELIKLRNEEEMLQSRLTELLNESPNYSITTQKELPVPNPKEILLAPTRGFAQSPEVEQYQAAVTAANAEKRLAYWSFGPDFQINYQKRIGGAPAESHIIGASMSIPLWFWGNTSRASSARANEQAAKLRLENSKLKVQSGLRALRSHVRSEYELFQILRTSIIPQALTSYNSARAAYRANKISFIDYLDSERSLLNAEISKFRTLTKLIEKLTQFEIISGTEILKVGAPS